MSRPPESVANGPAAIRFDEERLTRDIHDAVTDRPVEQAVGDERRWQSGPQEEAATWIRPTNRVAELAPQRLHHHVALVARNARAASAAADRARLAARLVDDPLIQRPGADVRRFFATSSFAASAGGASIHATR